MKTKRIGQARIDAIFEHQSATRSVFDWFPGVTADVVDRHRGWLAPTYMEPQNHHLVIVHHHICRMLSDNSLCCFNGLDFRSNHKIVYGSRHGSHFARIDAISSVSCAFVVDHG